MPSLNIPHGESVVKVSVIDNGARIAGPLSFFFDPPILDHLQDDDEFGAPAWVFFIEHPVSKRRLLFDLGIRANPSECTPENLKYHKAFRLIPGKEIYDYLGDHGVEPNTIEAIIWSHHHIDHTGNPTGFPETTDLIVGPGFKETQMPGYPTNEHGLVPERDYQGRNLRQLNFDTESSGADIGGFRAIDYFGDASFYLLETPGHSIDHISALARTSVSPPTYIFMGGDIGQHPGTWRPNGHTPLPKEITPSPFGLHSKLNSRLNVCPCDLFLAHVHARHSSTSPFLTLKAGHPHDVDQARECLKKLEVFEADENIMIMIAHDYTFIPVIDFFPKNANGWHEASWKKKSQWIFLDDFKDLVEAKAG